VAANPNILAGYNKTKQVSSFKQQCGVRGISVKIRTLRAAAFCGALAFCASVTAAQAATFIDFEDLNTGGFFINPPAGYAGLTWSGGTGTNSWAVSASSFGFFSGTQTHSGNNFVWNNFETNLSLSGGPFDFTSMWARIGVETSGTATVHGFNGATEIYTQTLNLTDTYQLFSLNFDGITSWTLTDQTSGTVTLMDDITLNGGTATPLPAALPLFAGGLGVIGLLARRRKRKAIATA
jgi:hypothetical protein